MKLSQRQIHLLGFFIWLGPGAVASWFLKDSVPWVNFMSWYAIVITHATGYAARKAEDAGLAGGENEI